VSAGRGQRAFVHYVLLPMVLLTVALLGGLRVAAGSGAFLFLAPPLVTLVLAGLLMSLFVRGGLVRPGTWVRSDQPLLANVSHILTLVALFAASAQAFNSVLPEQGLLHWLFCFFFLWTLWNNQFSPFDPARLLRSLAVLFGTAFVLKHMLLAGLRPAEGGWVSRVAAALLQGVSLGALDLPAFAPATGYISFFTVALYVGGLMLMPPAPAAGEGEEVRRLARAFLSLPPEDRARLREALAREEEGAQGAPPAPRRMRG
jgi:hypothetical protein